ncbi:MAG: SLC13 family permease, partial [Eubacteriales bacterium]
MSQTALVSPPAPRHPAHGSIAHALLAFAKKNVVFLIALVLAAVSMIFVRPDAEYLSYFDWSTLACLFSTLAVVGALGNIRFFTILAEKIVSLAGNLRTCVLCLTYITFLGSMLIANDMALLTFLPLSCFVLLSCKQEKHMALVFILQNAAANLGGMLTPFGNP